MPSWATIPHCRPGRRDRGRCGLYDFDAKYNNPQSELHIPADLSPEKLEEVRAAALRAYGAMGCEGLSRVDFFVTYDGEQVLLNEINTIPGQTPSVCTPSCLRRWVCRTAN